MRWLPTRRMMLRAADGTAGASAVGRLGAHRIELDAAELVQPIEQGGSCKGVGAGTRWRPSEMRG